MPEDTIKGSDKKWKIKAVCRQKIISKLKRENADLRNSRDKWKSKYIFLKKQFKKEAHCGVSLQNDGCAKGHQYGLCVVMFCISMFRYGSMSLRSCSHCLSNLATIFKVDIGCPCANSIRNWICKLGYYRSQCISLVRQDYVLWIDESIVIGGEKILLILGAPLKSLCFTKAISQQDVSVLHISVGKQWTSEQILPILSEIKGRVDIKYFVSDRGNNLVKSFKSGNYIHVPDCTHHIAKCLEKLYKTDERFIDFTENCAQYRLKWSLHTVNACYLPPKLRIKMRFANIFPLVDWALSILERWDTLAPVSQELLDFVKQNESLVRELGRLSVRIKSLQKVLKTRGFVANSCLENSKESSPQEQKFEQQMEEYFKELEAARLKIDLPSLVCTSDIIEGAFGKFKMKKAGNPAQKMTEFVLALATFTGVITKQEVRAALENVRMKDLKLYKQKQKEQAEKPTEKNQKVGKK